MLHIYYRDVDGRLLHDRTVGTCVRSWLRIRQRTEHYAARGLATVLSPTAIRGAFH